MSHAESWNRQWPMPRIAGAVLLAIAVCAWSGPAQAVEGDVDSNQAVDLVDLVEIRNNLGASGAPGFIPSDLNEDGTIGFDDVRIWREYFPSQGPFGPYLFIASPVDQSIIGNRMPVVLLDYSETFAPMNLGSLQIKLDGVDRTADAIINPQNAALKLQSPLLDGPHTVEASIADVTGEVNNAVSNFEVTSLALQPTANPVIGPAPLSVTFFPGVIWADNPPAFYSWDYTDDGTYEIVDPRPDKRTFVYTEEGAYTVRFRVTRSDNSEVSTTLNVYVTESIASASPSNGKGPLSVFLHGIAADPDDPITEYQWDYNFSGAFSADFTSTTSPNTPHVYVTPGVYRPVFRAVHQSGATTDHPIYQGEVRVNTSGTPVAIAAASQGPDPLTVSFAGSGSDDDGTIVLYEWDFENDGTWDYSSPSTGHTSHTYAMGGTWTAALRVTDNSAQSSVDRVRFETFAPATLEVLDDTIKPSDGEQTVIRTTTTIESTVKVYIRSREGRVVHTIVDNHVRPPGTYDDIWDGLDFRGELLHPGAYFAVLEYAYPGRNDRIDLAETTGDNHFFAPKIPPEATQFDALADNPLPMQFRIPKASRTSLYILPGGTLRTDTMFDDLALGAGDYTYYWAGLDDEGQFAPANTYLWTVNGWTLGDNVIVVQGQPAIDNVQVNPNRLSPTDRPLGSGQATVSFELDSPCTVFVNVFNMETGSNLRAFVLSNLSAGMNGVVWDGKTAAGHYVAPGFYRVTLLAVDLNANLSIEREAVMEIYY